MIILSYLQTTVWWPESSRSPALCKASKRQSTLSASMSTGEQRTLRKTSAKQLQETLGTDAKRPFPSLQDSWNALLHCFLVLRAHFHSNSLRTGCFSGSEEAGLGISPLWGHRSPFNGESDPQWAPPPPFLFRMCMLRHSGIVWDWTLCKKRN